MIRHHLNPVESLETYVVPEDLLPPVEHVLETRASGPRFTDRKLDGQRLEDFLGRDTWVQRNDRLRGKIARANELEPMELTDDEVADLVAFLKRLTDPASRNLLDEVPDRVPSGLPVED